MGADTTRWRDLAARLAPLPTDPETGVLGGVLTGRSGGLRVRRDRPTGEVTRLFVPEQEE